MLSVKKIAPYLDNKIRQSNRALQFRLYLGLMQGARYKMRSENLYETDCSGTICFPLFCMGFNIRITAQELFDRMFRVHVSIGEIQHDFYWNKLLAVFYEKAGRVSHVAPIIGRDAIFDAVEESQPAQIKAMEPVLEWYIGNGYSFYVREVDWDAADSVAKDPSNGWDREADQILKDMLK